MSDHVSECSALFSSRLSGCAVMCDSARSYQMTTVSFNHVTAYECPQCHFSILNIYQRTFLRVKT